MDPISGAGVPQVGPKAMEGWNKIQAENGIKAAPARVPKKQLDKDDFLKIMVTQMKYQDPTKPMDAEKMATEMAQIASVEQLTNVNKNIEKLSEKNSPIERLAMTQMMGKTITIDKTRFFHRANDTEVLSLDLPETAKSAKVTFFSETGEPVAQKDLGTLEKGSNSFTWDGKNENGIAVRPGNFFYQIEAKNEREAPIRIETIGKVRINGVSFEGAEPMFLTGSGRALQKIPMKQVIRFEEESGPTTAPIAGPNSEDPIENANPLLQDFLKAKLSKDTKAMEAAKGTESREPPANIPSLKGTANALGFEEGVPAQAKTGAGFPSGLETQGNE